MIAYNIFLQKTSDFQRVSTIDYLLGCLFVLFLQTFLVTCPPDLKKQDFPCKIVPIFFIFCICAILLFWKFVLKKVFNKELVVLSKELFVLSFALAAFAHPVLKDTAYWLLGFIEYWGVNFYEEKYKYITYAGIFVVLVLLIYYLTNVFIFVVNNYTDKHEDFSYEYYLPNKIIIFFFIFLLIVLYLDWISDRYNIDEKITRNIANEQIVKITEEVSKEMEKDDAFQDQIIIKKAVKLIEEVPQKEDKDSKEESSYKYNTSYKDLRIFFLVFFYIWLCLFFSSCKKRKTD